MVNDQNEANPVFFLLSWSTYYRLVSKLLMGPPAEEVVSFTTCWNFPFLRHSPVLSRRTLNDFYIDFPQLKIVRGMHIPVENEIIVRITSIIRNFLIVGIIMSPLIYRMCKKSLSRRAMKTALIVNPKSRHRCMIQNTVRKLN